MNYRAITLGLLLLAPSVASAQQLIRIPTCGTATPPAGVSPGYMDATGNQCSSATLSGGTITADTEAVAGASPPSYSPGANPLSQNLSGGMRMQPSLGGTDMTLGQKAMTASLPVVIASDQSAVPASQSGTWSVTSTVGTVTLSTLDIKTVTTGGTAVNALSAGNRVKGGWLQNPIAATVALCINEIGTASGTTSSGDTTCIQPGQSYVIAPAAGAVSVVTSDSSHPFSGMGFK